MLTDPLDRREVDQRIGISQEFRKSVTGFRATRVAQDQEQSQSPAGREVFCRGKRDQLIDLERTPQSLTGCLLNEGIIRFERFQKNILGRGISEPAHGLGTNQGRGVGRGDRLQVDT